MNIFDRLQEEVSIFDLFDLVGVKYMTKGKPSQISCPFHGDDAHPSARVYPDDNFMRCYYCSESWEVVKFWAQVNEWYRSDGKLDYKRSIDDLCGKYGITNSFSDWEKRFYALKKQTAEAEALGVPIEERNRLASFYSWGISQLVHQLPKEERANHKATVLSLWDDFTGIDLAGEGWQSDLISWYRSAKLDLYENRV